MNMKKLLSLAVVLAGILASCTSDDMTSIDNTPVEKNGTPIEFGGLKAAVTRADATGATAADLLGNNFVVEGVKVKGSSQSVVFDHYNVNYIDGSAHSTLSNTNGWEYVGQTVHANSSVTAQTIKYWDFSQDKYNFVAYSLGTTTGLTVSAIDPDHLTTAAYTIEGTADKLAGAYIADMVTVEKANFENVVTIRFRSLSAKIRIGLYETVPGYSVKDVKFYTDVKTAATDDNAYLYTTGAGNTFSNNGKYTVYFTEGRAHLSFTPATSEGTSNLKSYGPLANFSAKELGETTGNIYLGRNASEATFAGLAANNYYTAVTPNESGAELTLKVDYTLVSTDGSGEEIKVYGATAKVPAVYSQWTSGYAYTYLFKISNDTNGSTQGINPETGEPLGPAGLYPITFDAVVTETEDGVQETITTVATPSITTYTKGNVVTTNTDGEYEVGNNIYVVVGDGATALTVGTDAQLYTVTVESGAAQNITEQSIDNAIANGTYNSTAKTYTVTDANGKKLVVTENDGLSAITAIPAGDSPTGNAITVNGAMFTPAAAGTYVFQYMTAAAAGAVYSGPTTYGVGYVLDPDKSYFKKVGDDYVPYTNSVGDGSELYILTTPASPAKYIYKIIVVN